MNTREGIHFVYRSRTTGAAQHRARRLSAASVMAWFQAQIEEARTTDKAGEVASDALGGPVPGLSKLFEAARKLSLHTAKTPLALRKMLLEHLAPAGGDEAIRVDGHSVRVLESADPLGPAFYFFDDEAAEKAGEAAAALLAGGGAPNADWDPFAAPRKAKAPKGERPVREKADKPAKPAKPKSAKAKAAGEAAAAAAGKKAHGWSSAVAGRTSADAKRYKTTDRFDLGVLLEHPKFGLGVVQRVDGAKIEVLFVDGHKLLVQG